MAFIPADYEERVYAGVLGKIIGVYVGRPFEGWTHERIAAELGDIRYYVHERLGKPLIVADDDISGTFTFLRALPDYGNRPDLTSEQIGRTWLNYLIEKQTVLWWGGMGNSTEHTAYLRLKAGIPAPRSGSTATNGRVVAEQIGAQIFIDGWAMVCPGDPQRAAELARRAAAVSHDGEAIYGAQVVAAMEAQAFVEPDIAKLIDTGLAVIPTDCTIRRLIEDLRAWRSRFDDWHDCYRQIVSRYGYDKYGGNCHMVPNHALIIMALLYCDDSFQKAMTIVNTAGWDTDCNSGNVGCLMGIKNSLAGLEQGPDWRGPVADRMLLPTADGGRTMSDALYEAYEVARSGRALAGQPSAAPKGGARFHFSLPGAVQGFVPDESIESKGTTRIENVPGVGGARCLGIHYAGVAAGRCARAMREVLPAALPTEGYRIVASPMLYPGQTITARLSAAAADTRPVTVRLLVRAYGDGDQLVTAYGPDTFVAPGTSHSLSWRVEAPKGATIGWIGLEVVSEQRAEGTLYLDWLTWSGAPEVTLTPSKQPGQRWRSAWVQAADTFVLDSEHHYRIIHDEGTGLVIQGTRQWQDYVASATLTPHLARSFGMAARVQGLRRYYALRLAPGGRAELVRELDGARVLAEAPFAWDLYRPYRLALRVVGPRLVASIDGRELFSVEDAGPLDGGALAVWVEEGRLGVDDVTIAPAG
ncbi:MAG: ADP-ribosylglycohydrolase family protein [Anaerolineae bacterium]